MDAGLLGCWIEERATAHTTIGMQFFFIRYRVCIFEGHYAILWSNIGTMAPNRVRLVSLLAVPFGTVVLCSRTNCIGPVGCALDRVMSLGRLFQDNQTLNRVLSSTRGRSFRPHRSLTYQWDPNNSPVRIDTETNKYVLVMCMYVCLLPLVFVSFSLKYNVVFITITRRLSDAHPSRGAHWHFVPKLNRLCRIANIYFYTESSSQCVDR